MAKLCKAFGFYSEREMKAIKSPVRRLLCQLRQKMVVALTWVVAAGLVRSGQICDIFSKEKPTGLDVG